MFSLSLWSGEKLVGFYIEVALCPMADSLFKMKNLTYWGGGTSCPECLRLGVFESFAGNSRSSISVNILCHVDDVRINRSDRELLLTQA